MNQVTVKLDELIAALGNVKREFIRTEEVLEQRNIAIGEKEKKLSLFKNDLDLRETEIKKVENVVALKAEAESSLKTVRDEKVNLENERNKFRAYVEQENQNINVRKQEITVETSNIQKEYKNIALEKAKTEKEKGEFLQRLIKKMSEGVK
jgi:chromosome segregation ATPase